MARMSSAALAKTCCTKQQPNGGLVPPWGFWVFELIAVFPLMGYVILAEFNTTLLDLIDFLLTIMKIKLNKVKGTDSVYYHI